ncbi:MAG: NAD(+) diphosphatase [Pseudomonadota bacterium]
MKSANIYANTDLDRAAHLRRDASWIREKLNDGSSRILPIWRSRSLVVEGETPVSILLEPDRRLISQTQVVVFLGLMDEVAHFAIDVSHHEDPPFGDHGEFHDLRQVGPRMTPMEGGMIAYARAMMTWHKRHRFCGRCGSPTEIDQAGHVRKCTNEACGLLCFPRTDPAVIMLVHDGGDRVVLGRKPTMMPGLHTILAGFVEPGESMEDAVAREVYEEVGLHTTDIHYHSSQPWPFPANIMLGFTARATTFELTIDEYELEAGARWFTREELLNSPEDDTLRLPRVDSIARRLLNEWMEGG